MENRRLDIEVYKFETVKGAEDKLDFLIHKLPETNLKFEQVNFERVGDKSFAYKAHSIYNFYPIENYRVLIQVKNVAFEVNNPKARP